MEARLGDAQLEVFADLEAPEDFADLGADACGATQRVAAAAGGIDDLVELALGGLEQGFSLARPLLAEQRVLAHHQALARVVGIGDLGEVTLVE